MTQDPWFATLQEARATLAVSPPTQRAAYLLRRGSMRVGLYAPRGHDLQTPHDQDEVYLIHQGKADLVRGDERRRLVVGDVVFVAAGESHRFENFAEDFETWVFFWGPVGGEQSKAAS